MHFSIRYNWAPQLVHISQIVKKKKEKKRSLSLHSLEEKNMLYSVDHYVLCAWPIIYEAQLMMPLPTIFARGHRDCKVLYLHNDLSDIYILIRKRTLNKNRYETYF